MVLFFRILADTLWNVKLVAILLNAVVVLWFIRIIFHKPISKSVLPLYSIIGLLIVNIVYAFYNDQGDSVNIFFKVLCTFLVFVLGVNDTTVWRDSGRIEKLSMALLGIQLIMSLVGLGYQLWGGINTFSGFYYFKTDLALAVVIGLIYILYSGSLGKWVKIGACVVSLYLIFISNARIHLMTSFLIIILYLFQQRILHNSRKIILLGTPLVLVAFIVVIALVQTFFASSGLLLIDFEHFYSEENMQGRNVIWETLLDKFSATDGVNKLFGMGLTADVRISERYGHSQEVYNSHNGYLYLLISLGYVGLVLFFLFSWIIWSKFFKLSVGQQVNPLQGKMLMMFLSFAIIFYVSSFTNVTLIFQQETWFFIYYAGLLFNAVYFPQKKAVAVKVPRMPTIPLGEQPKYPTVVRL